MASGIAKKRPKEGDERYLVEMHAKSRVMAVAIERGHPGDDSSVMDYCEPHEAASFLAFHDLNSAVEHAKRWVAGGNDFWGCTRIEHQRFERYQPGMHPEWECVHTYEVDETGIVNDFAEAI